MAGVLSEGGLSANSLQDVPEQPGRIPNAKAPRTRPPSSLRDKLGFLHCSMPKFSGPYSVGTMEIEVPVERPRNVSGIKRDHIHLLRLESVLFTMYYPCAHGSGRGRDPSGSRRWSRETWLPRPRVGTAHGYGKFAGLGPAVIPFFAATSMFTKLPAYRNADLADHWPPHHNMHDLGSDVKFSAGIPPPGESEQPSFPLLIFSHGLGGTRTMYSSLCGEFASYGFVVVAMEHRDGSAPRSYVNYPKSEIGSVEEREKRGISHKPNVGKRRYDTVEYVYPIGNPMDTSPNNDKGVDSGLRNAQLELRICEIEEAYRVIARIARGDGKAIEEENLRRKGYKGSSSRGLAGVNWARWTNRVYLDDVTIAGHSFGAATTVELLRKYPSRFPQLKQGIIYDIWGAPVRAARETARKEGTDSDSISDRRINRPLLAINSEAFTYWRSNFDLVMSVIQEARQEDVLAWLMTIRGTVHVNQSDFPLLYPNLCSWFLKTTADPKRALDLNIDASLEFLKVVMPARIAQLNRALKSENLLDAAVLDPKRLPTNELRRPAQKWIAARLKIPNEMRWRLSPKLAMRRYRRRHEGKGNLGSEGFGRPTSEIWMHVAPTRPELQRLGRKESLRMGMTGNSDDPRDGQQISTSDDSTKADGQAAQERNAQHQAAQSNMAGNDDIARMPSVGSGSSQELKANAKKHGQHSKKSLAGRIERTFHVGHGFD